MNVVDGNIIKFSLSLPQIEPSHDLEWHPCFDGFHCARLKVPWDYSNRRKGYTNVAFVKKNASKQPAKSVLMNPGGPGVSGIEYLVLEWERHRSILGDQFNLVSFDPRGVERSAPDLECSEDISTLPRNCGAYQDLSLIPDASSPDSLAFAWYKGQIQGQQCAEFHRETFARYANTPAVARDMLQYLEREDRLEGRSTKGSLLNYFGTSYGTILGLTFASLFPDRVGRFVLQSTSDVEH